MVWPVLLCDVTFDENKVTIQTKFFRVFINPFAFLSSIRGFPEASEGEKNQVNANVGEFCSVI